MVVLVFFLGSIVPTLRMMGSRSMEPAGRVNRDASGTAPILFLGNRISLATSRAVDSLGVMIWSIFFNRSGRTSRKYVRYLKW